MNGKYKINSLNELSALASRFVSELEHDLVLLCGELGSGKTTLTKLICAELGIDSNVVISPTYTLLNIYPLPNGKCVHHLDLYRLSSFSVLDEFEEWLNADGLTLIEWPELALDYLSQRPYVRVSISHLPNQERLFNIECSNI